MHVCVLDGSSLGVSSIFQILFDPVFGRFDAIVAWHAFGLFFGILQIFQSCAHQHTTEPPTGSPRKPLLK